MEETATVQMPPTVSTINNDMGTTSAADSWQTGTYNYRTDVQGDKNSYMNINPNVSFMNTTFDDLNLQLYNCGQDYLQLLYS